MAKSVAHGGEFLDRSVQLVRLVGEHLRVDSRPAVRSEHRGDLVEREPGGLSQRYQFMTTAERAAAPLVAIPPREPNAPGQFAFADAMRVRSLLDQSGWSGIDIQPIDVACTLPEKDLVRYLTLLGPLGRVLADVDASTRTRVADAVRPAFDPFVDGSEVRFTAACWMVAASA